MTLHAMFRLWGGGDRDPGKLEHHCLCCSLHILYSGFGEGVTLPVLQPPQAPPHSPTHVMHCHVAASCTLPAQLS